LEPIFTSEDISQQLPTETKKFAMIDRFWRKLMSQAQDRPLLIDFLSDRKILEGLLENIKVAEIVSKGLSLYLDSKRLAFPRFFFLSDDELLQILSQTKNPASVQPHLRKCFENIAQLVMESDNKIKAMVSGDGEIVPFHQEFYPQGAVEEWLLKVENSMKSSVRESIRSALVDYLKMPRAEWVLKWPGQVVIGVGQTFWTQQVTEAIQDSASNGLQKLHATLNSQLQELVALIRTDISPVARLVLEQLIVIEVHARDVVQRLIEHKVSNVNDFEWMSQLRYYWEADDLIVKIVNARFKYGYEYLGNTGRLVITPLTDRCYLTLAMAMSLNLGGAPQGNYIYIYSFF
jgi:dynein heavy chain